MRLVARPVRAGQPLYLPYISPIISAHLVARPVRAGQPVLGQQALLLLLLTKPRLHRGDTGEICREVCGHMGEIWELLLLAEARLRVGLG